MAGSKKVSIGYKILAGYGFVLILVLWYIGVASDWTYFHSENILLFAFLIASYPILGIVLTLLGLRYVSLRV